MDIEKWRRIVASTRHRTGSGTHAKARREVALDETLAHELRQEQATSLARVGRRIEQSIDELIDLATAWRTAPPAQREDLAQTFAETRRRALQARWELMVQREAIGLVDHAILERLYPIPQTLR